MCARCPEMTSYVEPYGKGPLSCPTRTHEATITKALEQYKVPELNKFSLMASRQEGEGYRKGEREIFPIKSRVEEIIEFAQKMGYKRLGIAFCIGVKYEASLLTDILEGHGFEVISVCCKAGGIPKEFLGIKDEEKIRPGGHESMCNPIAQAQILNEEKADFNILMGICVGHDSLFFRYSEAPVTVLFAKDRLLGHNPAAALYTSTSYYRRLRQGS